MENYDNEILKNLSPNDAKAYVTKYFIPLSNGDHAMLINGKYEIIDDSTVKKVYFNRMPKTLSQYYFTEYAKIRTIEYKLNKETLHDNFLNLCPKLKHKYKEYKKCSAKAKKGVKIMLDYIKEVLCSGSEESSVFLVKWLSNMAKGNKNNSCIYLKGPQGLGKSTLPEFLRFWVIGEDLTLESGSGPLKSNFNAILGGKLLVYFEELENFSTGEWNVISSRLKRQMTSSKIVLEKKGIDPYEAENMNNYMALSNNDSLKDDDGRRYFILDLSTARIGDTEFWDNIHENCMNDEVGEAFYCYLLEIDTDKFNPQSFPISKKPHM